MSAEKIIRELELTIKRVSKDIKKKQGAVGSDKIDSLSKLVNSYSRLIELNQSSKGENENKKPCYVEVLKKSYEQ